MKSSSVAQARRCCHRGVCGDSDHSRGGDPRCETFANAQVARESRITCGGVSQDCHEWVDRNGYQLAPNDWWAKTDGCVARTPAGDELSHSEEFRNKAIGWVWEFAISAVGTLPAVAIVAISELRFRRNGPDDA